MPKNEAPAGWLATPVAPSRRTGELIRRLRSVTRAFMLCDARQNWLTPPPTIARHEALPGRLSPGRRRMRR